MKVLRKHVIERDRHYDFDKPLAELTVEFMEIMKEWPLSYVESDRYDGIFALVKKRDETQDEAEARVAREVKKAIADAERDRRMRLAQYEQLKKEFE